MNAIKYITGDATRPKGKENKIIVHVCNDVGGWGKGFVLAISKRWKSPEIAYRNWFISKEDFALGKVQFVNVEPNLWVANLIGQHKISKGEIGNPPIRYEAIENGITHVLKKAKELKASVHMPRIGCGLAGGKWEHIEPILQERLVQNEIKTVVYDF